MEGELRNEEVELARLAQMPLSRIHRDSMMTGAGLGDGMDVMGW